MKHAPAQSQLMFSARAPSWLSGSISQSVRRRPTCATALSGQSQGPSRLALVPQLTVRGQTAIE